MKKSVGSTNETVWSPTQPGNWSHISVVHSSNNRSGLGLYVGCARFESQSGNRLSWGFRSYPKSVHEIVGIVLRNKASSASFHIFPTYYSLSSKYSTSYSLSYLQHRQITNWKGRETPSCLHRPVYGRRSEPVNKVAEIICQVRRPLFCFDF
jgi:hypothetical protein